MKLSATFLVLVLLNASLSSSERTGNAAPPKPTFQDNFSVEVEAIFLDKNSEANGAMYYDRKNNRATMDIEYQNESMRKIYDFNENQVIEIKGTQCQVKTMSDNPNESFFPFTVDKKTKKKTIGSPEEALYFNNSMYESENFDLIPIYVYEGKVDVNQYNQKDCLISHHFSKPDFETANCDDHDCVPTLLSISVKCGQDEKAISHVYKMFHFKNKIEDNSVFQAPPGVHCSRNGTQRFPTLPSYFSFSYDINKRLTNVESVGGIHILHKAVWYDGDLQLVRIDEFKDNGLVSSSKVYDFINEVSYITFPALAKCDMGALTKDFSLEQATLLPSIIFPWKFGKDAKKPAYVGQRTSNGLDYDVWSVTAATSESSISEVTDIYFTKAVPNTSGVVEKYELQLAYVDSYVYEKKSTDGEIEIQLSETIFAPVNHFRSSPRDWSAFDVSLCFDKDEKKAFELKIEGETVERENAAYNDLLEELYLRMITSSGVSVVRISELKAVSNADNILVFRGIILENPMVMGYGKNNTEPSVTTAYKNIESDIKTGIFTFNVTKEGKDIQYKATSIKEFKVEKKQQETDKSKTYSPGSMAAVAVIMLLLGLILGVIGFFVYLRTRKTSEAAKLINSP